MDNAPPATTLNADALARLDAGRGTPGEATTRLAELKAAYDERMSPAPPTQPTNAVEAAARLDYLTKGKDPAWSQRWNEGHAETMREWRALTEQARTADPNALAIAGVVPPSPPADENTGAVPTGLDLVAGAKDLRARGFSESNINEVYSGVLVDDAGKPLPADEVARRVANGERLIEQIARDPALRKAFLAGEYRDVLDRVAATIAVGKRP